MFMFIVEMVARTLCGGGSENVEWVEWERRQVCWRMSKRRERRWW